LIRSLTQQEEEEGNTRMENLTDSNEKLNERTKIVCNLGPKWNEKNLRGQSKT